MLAASAESASPNVESCRSIDTGSSWNAGSKTMFTSASFARSVNTSRLLACALVWSVDGSFRPLGSSRPSGGRSRVRAMSACSRVWPWLVLASCARRLLRATFSSRSMSPLAGLSSAAIWYSSSASSYFCDAARRRARKKWALAARSLARSSAWRASRLSGAARTAFVYSTTARS